MQKKEYPLVLRAQWKPFVQSRLSSHVVSGCGIHHLSISKVESVPIGADQLTVYFGCYVADAFTILTVWSDVTLTYIEHLRSNQDKIGTTKKPWSVFLKVEFTIFKRWFHVSWFSQI